VFNDGRREPLRIEVSKKPSLSERRRVKNYLMIYDCSAVVVTVMNLRNIDVFLVFIVAVVVFILDSPLSHI
jgi:hypothetical protein